MGHRESLLTDPVTADDESCSLYDMLAESDSVDPVSRSEAEPKYAWDKQRGATGHSCMFTASGSPHPEDLAQKEGVRRSARPGVPDHCTEAGALMSLQHGLCLLEHSPKKVREGCFAHQKDCRERLKVRVCVLAAPLMHATWKAGTKVTADLP
jgi:hypothetical protein